MAVMKQWETEINKFYPDYFIVVIYHGKGREVFWEKKAALRAQEKPVIVLVSYETYRSEYTTHNDPDKKPTKKKLVKEHQLRLLNWKLVALDEAHIINNPESKISQCVTKLRADKRLCLTGTPLNNKEEDIYSICRFLKSPLLEEREFWNGVAQNSQKLERVVEWRKEHMLRRTVDSVNLGLPTPNEYIDIVTPSESEQQRMTHLLGLMRDAMRKTKGDKRAYYNVLMCYLVRIRQLPNSESLLPNDLLEDTADDILDEHDLQGEGLLPDSLVEKQGKEEKEVEIDEKQISTKTQRIIDLATKEAKTETGNIIIYSQWVRYLEILNACLKKHKNVIIYKLNGKMTKEQCQDSLAGFANNTKREGKRKILLCSVGKGGVGLNLTCSDTIIMADQLYNPFKELQARGRIYRIGQIHHINVYYVRTTFLIEKLVSKLKEKKMKLAQTLVDIHSTSAMTMEQSFTKSMSFAELEGLVKELLKSMDSPVEKEEKEEKEEKKEEKKEKVRKYTKLERTIKPKTQPTSPTKKEKKRKVVEDDDDVPCNPRERLAKKLKIK